MNPLVYGFFNLRQSRQSPNTRVSFLYTLLIYSYSYEIDFFNTHIHQILNHNFNNFNSHFLFPEHDNTSNNSRFSLSYEYSDDNLHAYAKKSNSCQIKSAGRSLDIELTSYSTIGFQKSIGLIFQFHKIVSIIRKT